MTRILTTTAILLVSGGLAHADCQAKMDAFARSMSEGGVRASLGSEEYRALRELRSVARVLVRSDNAEACAKVVDAIEALYASGGLARGTGTGAGSGGGSVSAGGDASFAEIAGKDETGETALEAEDPGSAGGEGREGSSGQPDGEGDEARADSRSASGGASGGEGAGTVAAEEDPGFEEIAGDEAPGETALEAQDPGEGGEDRQAASDGQDEEDRQDRDRAAAARAGSGEGDGRRAASDQRRAENDDTGESDAAGAETGDAGSAETGETRNEGDGQTAATEDGAGEAAETGETDETAETDEADADGGQAAATGDTDMPGGEDGEAAKQAARMAREDASATDRTDDEASPPRLSTIAQVRPDTKLDELVGYNVYNLAGEFIGEIDGFLVAEGEDTVTHILLSHGGFWSIGDEEAVVPASMIAYSRTEDVFYIDITQQELDQAPDYDVEDGKWAKDGDKEANDNWYRERAGSPAASEDGASGDGAGDAGENSDAGEDGQKG